MFSLLHKISTNLNTRRLLGALAQGLERLEKFLHTTGTVGYAVGNTHTIACIHLLAHITFIGSGFWDGISIDSDKFPRITSIRKNIASHESIKAYYDRKGEKNKYDELYIAARDLPTSGGECKQEVRKDKVGGTTKWCLSDITVKNVKSFLVWMSGCSAFMCMR